VGGARPGEWGAALLAVCGCVALAVRPPGSFSAVLVTGAVGAVGALAPLRRDEVERPRGTRWLVAVGMGITAFAIGRWLRVAVAPAPVTTLAVGASLLAAAAEELFFRRFVYGWLIRWGAWLAVGGSAMAFAIVHVPVYGVRALPIDLAAGVLFGWQRWAAGTWSASAVTHAAANLLQMS